MRLRGGPVRRLPPAVVGETRAVALEGSPAGWRSAAIAAIATIATLEDHGLRVPPPGRPARRLLPAVVGEARAGALARPPAVEAQGDRDDRGGRWAGAAAERWPPPHLRPRASDGRRRGWATRRGQATIELLAGVGVVLGLVSGVVRLAGGEIVRAQAEHAVARGLEARAAGQPDPGAHVLQALPSFLRRSSRIVVGPAALTLTIDPAGPLGPTRIVAPVPELP